MPDEVRYDAFISYRHCDLDKYVAENLHRELENFKTPQYLIKKYPDIKKRITRVFRDEDELPLSTDLADSINVALKNSEFLIVICTPRLKESQWCMKEIDRFIEMHGRERVLAVLAEGEPGEAFPEQLTYKDVTVIDANGTKQVVREAVEPLAADVRAGSRRDILREMRSDIFRLVAAIIGVNYDELKRRHHERKMRRIIGWCAAITLVFGTFGAVSLTQAIRIKNQSREIERQNEDIKLQNEQIIAQDDRIRSQADKIEEQYMDLQNKYLESVVESAHSYLTKGRKDIAVAQMKTVVEGYDKGEYSFSPNLQKEMTEVMGFYNAGISYMPMDVYSFGGNLNEMSLSQKGEYLALIDSNEILHVWNLSTNEEVVNVEDVSYLDAENTFGFIDNENVMYRQSDDVFCLLNVATGESTQIGGNDTTVYMLGNGEYYIWKENPSQSFVTGCYCTEDSRIGYAYEDNSSECEYCVLNADSEREITIEIGNDHVYDMMCTDGVYYVSVASMSLLSYERCELMAIDGDTGEVLWHCDTPMTIRKMKYLEGDENDKLFAAMYDRYMIINAATGESIAVYDAGGRILDVVVAGDNNAAAILRDDGSALIGVEDNEPIEFSDYSVAPMMSANRGILINGRIYLHFEGMDYITVYKTLNGNDEHVDEVCASEESCYVYDVIEMGERDELCGKYNIDASNVCSMVFSQDNKYLCVSYNSGAADFYDSTTHECVKRFAAGYRWLDSVQYSKVDDVYLVTKSDDNNLLLDSELEEIADVFSCRTFDEKDGRLIFYANGVKAYVPFYSFDEICRMVKED